MLDPGSPQRRANRSGANDSDTHEYLLVLRESQPSAFSAPSKTRHQKWPRTQEPESHFRGPSSAHGDKLFLRNAAVPGGATICGQKARDACSRLMRRGVFSVTIALSGASKRGV